MEAFFLVKYDELMYRGRLVATALLDVQDRARCSVEASADWYTSGWLCFTI